MLFFAKVKVDHTRIDEDELWDLWEQEAESALAAKSHGKIRALYKVAGQRRVVMILTSIPTTRSTAWLWERCPCVTSWRSRKCCPFASTSPSPKT